MLAPDTIRMLARRLYDARKSRTQLRHFSAEHRDMTIEDGYAIQTEWVKMEVADGRTIKGRKIGLTSRAMQQASQITEPDYAPLMDDMFFAAGSDIPEDHFNQAMAQVQVGDIEGAHATWQRVFDLSYAHKEAPETSTFFQKKLLFAQLLRDAGACDARGLDLLTRQLMGFYTNYRVTDASFWGIRGVPAFEDVMLTTRDYYRAMGKPAEEWATLCDTIAGQVDEEGAAYCAELRDTLGAG